jgi:hypothetical protein
MAMPGMAGGAAMAANPAVALVLPLFMLGHMMWTADRLANQVRARAVPARGARPGGNEAAGMAGGTCPARVRLLHDRDEPCHGLHAAHDAVVQCPRRGV